MKTDTPQQECPLANNDRDHRRRFLRCSGVAALAVPAMLSGLGSSEAIGAVSGKVPVLGASEPSPMQGAVAGLDPMMSRRLHLINEHTGDDIDVVYYTHGIYIHENLSMLNNLMRDRRANISTQMDTTLYNQLFLLHQKLGTEEPVHILSGYRTAETNAKLRKRSKGVAKYSLHMEGRAADIYIPGYSAKKIQKAALSLQAGGVGLYSQSNFVHIDTGQVRHWGG